MQADGEDVIQARITGFWSMVAPQYEAHPGNVPERDSEEYAAWVEALAELLPTAPADVLGIATGTGFVALIAARLGHRVAAIDLSAEMLDEAKGAAAREGLEIAFVRDDAVAPSFPEGSFDAIVCRHLVWTLRTPEEAFRNWRRLLRPGGQVIAIDGFWLGASGPKDEGDGEAPNIFAEHYTPETRAALPISQLSAPGQVADVFRAAGFDNVTVGDLAQVHALAKDPPGDEPWYVVVAR